MKSGKKKVTTIKARKQSKSHSTKTKLVKKQSDKSTKSKSTKKSGQKIQIQEKKEIRLDYSIDKVKEKEKTNIKLKMHYEYIIEQNHELYKRVQNLYHLFIDKQKTKDQKLHQLTQFSYFPSFQFKLNNEKQGQQKCSICQFQFQQAKNYEAELADKNDEDIVALKCSHKMHFQCLKMLLGDKLWLKCPVCSTIYGCMEGDQPPGQMSIITNSLMHCSGYEDVGTIIISYSMRSGKRGNISFPQTHRTAYLPDNAQGNQVKELLEKAFNRNLIFTIGRSVTTGRDNQIVWNGIHHKTNTSGGAAYFGYPDPTYFQRVKLQLAAKGVH